MIDGGDADGGTAPRSPCFRFDFPPEARPKEIAEAGLHHSREKRLHSPETAKRTVPPAGITRTQKRREKRGVCGECSLNRSLFWDSRQSEGEDHLSRHGLQGTRRFGIFPSVLLDVVLLSDFR